MVGQACQVGQDGQGTGNDGWMCGWVDGDPTGLSWRRLSELLVLTDGRPRQGKANSSKQQSSSERCPQSTQDEQKSFKGSRQGTMPLSNAKPEMGRNVSPPAITSHSVLPEHCYC